mgnify:CR=1 FL=1
MMENVQSIIVSIITVVVLFLALSFGSTIFKSVIDRMWNTIENLVGETASAFIAIFVSAALIIACIYGAVK